MRRLLSVLVLCASGIVAAEPLGPSVQFPNIPEIPLPKGVDFDEPFR